MPRDRVVSAIVSSASLLVAPLASAEVLQRGASAASSVSGERGVESSPAPVGSASAAAEDGLLLPSVMPARLLRGSVFATARSGYDGASDAFVARAVAEANLASFLALHLDFEHGPSMGPENRLRIGGRVQLLNSADHGIDGAVGLFYDPNDFREEGNIVGGLLVGRRFGRLGLFGNVLFGSDPEGDDQALELRVAPLYRVTSSVQLGLDARGRYNMSSDEKRAGTLTRDFEINVLPTASVAFGSFAVVAEAGLSAQRTTGPFGEPTEVSKTSTGVLTLVGAGAAF